MALTGRSLVLAMCVGQVGNLLAHVVVPAVAFALGGLVSKVEVTLKSGCQKLRAPAGTPSEKTCAPDSERVSGMNP